MTCNHEVASSILAPGSSSAQWRYPTKIGIASDGKIRCHVHVVSTDLSGTMSIHKRERHGSEALNGWRHAELPARSRTRCKGHAHAGAGLRLHLEQGCAGCVERSAHRCAARNVHRAVAHDTRRLPHGLSRRRADRGSDHCVDQLQADGRAAHRPVPRIEAVGRAGTDPHQAVARRAARSRRQERSAAFLATVQRSHRVLHRAMADTVCWNLISFNPLTHVRAP